MPHQVCKLTYLHNDVGHSLAQILGRMSKSSFQKCLYTGKNSLHFPLGTRLHLPKE